MEDKFNILLSAIGETCQEIDLQIQINELLAGGASRLLHDEGGEGKVINRSHFDVAIVTESPEDLVLIPQRHMNDALEAAKTLGRAQGAAWAKDKILDAVNRSDHREGL